MEAIYEACERLGLVIFLHPHYGVAGNMGDYGHVLPLALGRCHFLFLPPSGHELSTSTK